MTTAQASAIAEPSDKPRSEDRTQATHAPSLRERAALDHRGERS
jgi:hypothetical protein